MFSKAYFPRPVFRTAVLLLLFLLFRSDLAPFFVSACLTVLFPKNLLLIIGLFINKYTEKS